MNREKVIALLQQEAVPYDKHEPISEMDEVRSTANQIYWDYQQVLESPDFTRCATEETNDFDSEKTLFNYMKARAEQSIEANMEILRLPEVRRLAEYFGIIPTQESEYKEYRSFEDRRQPLLLPSEKDYIQAKQQAIDKALRNSK